MELWFVYAMLMTISAGIGNIFQKIIAEKKINPAYLLFVQGSLFIGVSLIGLVFFGGVQEVFSWEVILFALASAVLLSISTNTKIYSLGYLDASEFFIGYRVLSTLLGIMLGLSVFLEHISSGQYFGIAVGFLAIFFLYEPRKKVRAQRELSLGIFFLVLTALASVLINILSKDFSLSGFSLFAYLFWQGVGVLAGFLFTDYKKIGDIHTLFAEVWKYLIPLLMVPFFRFIVVITNILTYQAGGNLGVVMKIFSYSLFIPIIYSAIVYHEKLSWKKYIAMILTVISIWFLF